MSVSVPDRPSPDFTDPEQRFSLSFEEAIEIVRAIENGEVDALVTRGHEGSRVSFLDTSISTYALLVEQSHDALFVLDEHGRIIVCGTRLAALVGMTPETLSGCAFEEVVAPDSLSRFRRFVANALSDRAREEIHVRPRDGRPDVAIAIEGRALEHTDIGERAICAAAVDLTVEQRSRELEDAVTRFRRACSESETLLRHAPIGLAIVDRDLRYVKVNEELARLHDLPVSAHIGAKVREILPDLAAKIEPLIYRVLSAGRRIPPRELQVSTPSNPEEKSVWRVTCAPVLDEEGGTSAVSMVVEDVTSDWRQEEALRNRLQTAETSLRRKSEILALMSHEIRAPLSSLLSFADIFARQLCDPEALDLVESIRRNSYLLLDFLNGVLELEKVEAGRAALETRRFAPDPFIADVVHLLRASAAQRGLELRLEFLGEIPDTIETDPTKLRQVLFNLLNNAIKYTEEGAVTLRVGLAMDAGEPSLAFEVADTGIGMSAEQVMHLYEPYYQARSRPGLGGAGLGLMIARSLVSLLGGTMDVRSSPGAGTEFRFTIAIGPCEGVPLRPPRIDAQLTVEREAPARLSGHILVVDDRPEAQVLLRRYLEDAGAEVDVASDGVKALHKVEAAERENRRYIAVVLDVLLLHGFDGYEVASRLRARGFCGVIVGITPRGEQADRDRSIAAGCDDAIARPVDKAALIESIQRAWALRRPLDEGEARALGFAAAGPHTDRWVEGEEEVSVRMLDPASADASERRRGDVERHDLRRASVLLVDENPDVLSGLEILFCSRGYDVRTCVDPNEALDAARVHEPDIVILDIDLPRLSGRELCRRMRAEGWSTDVIFIALTARDDEDECRLAREAGFHHCLTKPVSFEEIERCFPGR